MTTKKLHDRITSLCSEVVKLHNEINGKTAAYKKYHDFEWGQIDGAGKYAKAILEYFDEYAKEAFKENHKTLDEYTKGEK